MTTVRAIATQTPQHSINQEDALHIAKLRNQPRASQEFWMRAIYSKSGVSERYSVLLEQSASPQTLPENRQSFYADKIAADDLGPTTAQRMQQYCQHAPELAVQVCTAALTNSDLKPADITHLITVSCTGFAAPGIDIHIIKQLPLDPGVARTHIGFMGCHGAMNALRVADHLVRANPQAKVLICTVELCSLHYQYDFHPDQIIANALFADGAAAMCVTADPTADPTVDNTTQPQLHLIGNGSYLFPDSLDAMTWQVGDHGFAMTLSPRVPELIDSQLKPWLESWLRTYHLSIADIDHWAIHPGGPKILDAVLNSLGLAHEKAETSRNILRSFGNMSSPTSFFVLQAIQSQKATGKCLMLGFGPGLAAEVALLDFRS
jgi:predicted naringenin-chalcone synthase